MRLFSAALQYFFFWIKDFAPRARNKKTSKFLLCAIETVFYSKIFSSFKMSNFAGWKNSLEPSYSVLSFYVKPNFDPNWKLFSNLTNKMRKNHIWCKNICISVGFHNINKSLHSDCIVGKFTGSVLPITLIYNTRMPLCDITSICQKEELFCILEEMGPVKVFHDFFKNSFL